MVDGGRLPRSLSALPPGDVYALKAAVGTFPHKSGEKGTEGGGGELDGKRDGVYKVHDDSLACKGPLKPNQPGNCTSLRLFRYVFPNIPRGRSCAVSFFIHASRVMLVGQHRIFARIISIF